MNRRRVLLGLTAVGAFIAVDLGAVFYADGRGGSRLTQRSFLEAFRSVSGAQLGFRKNHAKGVAVTGYFDSNGNGRELSRAEVFGPGRTLVQGRFSLAGGDHAMADTGSAARGLGLVFGRGAQQWRMATINLPVFPDRCPQGFYERLIASAVLPDTGKPDPQATARFQAAHPETVAAMALIKAQVPTSSFADSTFRGLNAFYLLNASDARTPVRWSLAPLGAPPAPARVSAKDQNWLFDDLVRQLRTRPLRWRLLLMVGSPSDPSDDATVAWPADRRVIDAGTLTLDSIFTEAPGNARDINFDPLVLPDGIEPSDDPLLSARSAIYSASYRLRAREPKSPSAVDVDAVSL